MSMSSADHNKRRRVTASGTGSRFPIRVSADRRYLVEADGSPFLMIGDSAWLLVTNLTKAETGEYLRNRRDRGYNAILAEAIVTKAYTWSPPLNREGKAPFSVPGDFSTPEEAYFAHLDWVVRQAHENGIAALLFPCFLGVQAGTDGWWEEVIANGRTRCRNYGRYLGTRYRDFGNIIWVHGGDYNVPAGSAGAVNALEILLGIKDTAPAHLHTFHQARLSTAFGEPTFGPNLDLDATYSGDLTYPESLLAYNRKGFGPHFLLEARYEGTQSYDGKVNSPGLVRAGAYWAQLSGATGQVSGTCNLWSFGWDGQDWRAAVESATTSAMEHFRKLFERRAWQRLLPDQNHLTVTAGYGTYGELDYVTVARTEDGARVMAYVPPSGGKSRTLTVNMGRLSASATAKWFNPRNGDYTTIAGSPFSNEGSRSFITPGGHEEGENDWVLVLEALKP